MVALSGVFLNRLAHAGEAPEGLTTGVAGFMDTLRALARETREKRKIKLIYIAAASDRGESALSRWETGLTDAPGHLDRVIDAYAQAFGMTAIELVEAVARRMREEAAGEAVVGEIKPPNRPSGQRSAGKRPPSRKPGRAPRPQPTRTRSRER